MTINISEKIITIAGKYAAMSEAPEPEKSRFNSEFVVAVSAIIISVITAIVSGYQTIIMRDQQLMAAWPYVEWYGTLDETEGLSITVTNKGVGPALIKRSSLKLDGQTVDAKQYLERLVSNLDTLTYSFNHIDNRVLAPGDQLVMLAIHEKEVAKRLTMEIFARTQLEICFCDIYGSCWMSKGFTVTESDCNK